MRTTTCGRLEGIVPMPRWLPKHASEHHRAVLATSRDRPARPSHAVRPRAGYRLLLDDLDRLGNMVACKRLGYFIEALELDAEQLAMRCLERRSAGLSRLDPAITVKGRIAKRWGLRVNVGIRSEPEEP